MLPKLKDCVKSVLIRNHDEPEVVLDIAPTMQNITHNGDKYFRMPNTRHEFDDGTWGGCYLWSGYRDYVLAKHRERDAPQPAPTPTGDAKT